MGFACSSACICVDMHHSVISFITIIISGRRDADCLSVVRIRGNAFSHMDKLCLLGPCVVFIRKTGLAFRA